MYNRFLALFLVSASFLILMGSVATLQTNTYAKVDNEFSRPYGLMVHSGNLDRPIPRIKALEVLLNYFSDAANSETNNASFEVSFEDVKKSFRSYVYVEKGCSLKLFDCSEAEFDLHGDVSQQDFLSWFFKLKYFSEPDFLAKKYPRVKNDYSRNWLQARRMNYLSGKTITYSVLQEFLYRNNVVEKNLDMPYSEALSLGLSDINENNFHSLKEIESVQQFLTESISDFEGRKKLSKKEKVYLGNLKEQLPLFQSLEKSLLKSPYVLSARPDLDPEITRIVREHNLQEVLFSYSYDYSDNAYYRKHNLTTGVKKMHGKVFMPGEVLDYWKIISDKNLWDFKYGWVTVGGLDKWLFGGGICGSSSMVFLPAWKSGLEIVERRSHSNYYSYLYPMGDIGLDATVYRPNPNLKIRNNMENPIVFNVINDKENEVITMEIIGNRDYKNIRIEGPIYESKNRVKWIRHMEGFDGKIKSEELNSAYSRIQ